MRQVDDFAIATNAERIAIDLIAEINQHLRLPLHILGRITRYNRMEIEQTRDYVKIHCAQYLRKLEQTSGTHSRAIRTGKTRAGE
jgi:hypothetical protein